MGVNRYDRLFAHVASIIGLLTASQVNDLFSAVESGEARDMATAAVRAGHLAGDVAAALGIVSAELASRRIAEAVEPESIISSGKSGEGVEKEPQLYPKSIGPYRNLKQIARGAMGIVFRGERESDGAIVALKVLPLQMVREDMEIERFKREIETITSLIHPNIVRVSDFGQDDDFYYYAMEYIDGRSLRELIHDRGHLSPYHAAEIVRDAGRGLAFAHQHGIIHRDVKPSNVMITRAGQVKLVDFGLAFRKASEILTASGISLGTPAYMSPEQIEGGRIDITEKTDIYSLGVTLYESLAGRRPFEGENQYDVMKHVLFDSPPSVQELNPTVPQVLCEVLDKAMAKDPEERFDSMSELIRALDEFIDESSGTKG